MPRKGARQTMMFSATFPKEIQVSASISTHLFLLVHIIALLAAVKTIRVVCRSWPVTSWRSTSSWLWAV